MVAWDGPEVIHMAWGAAAIGPVVRIHVLLKVLIVCVNGGGQSIVLH